MSFPRSNEKQSGRRENRPIQRPKSRTSNEYRHQKRKPPQHLVSKSHSNSGRCQNILSAQDDEIRYVGNNVGYGDDGHRDAYRPRKVPVRILQLLRDVVQVVPPGEREQPRVERQSDVPGLGLRPFHRILEVLGVPGAQVVHPCHDYDAEGEYLRRREDVLHPRHPLNVVAVDQREEAGGGGREEAHCLEGRLAGAPERLKDVLSEGDRGDGVAGRDQDEQGDPEVEERGQGTEGLADVGVVAARLGDHSA